MRIALVAFNFAEYVARLALSLARSHEVTVYVSKRAADREWTSILRSELEQTVKVDYLPHPFRKSMVVDGFLLAKKIGRTSPDVVHFQESGVWTLWACRKLSWFQKSAFVLTVHDPRAHSGEESGRAKNQWAVERLRREADAIIVHGDALAKEIRIMEPAVDGRVFAVPHGALGGLETAAPPPGDGRFLFFGRIHAYKGLGVLLDATQLLAARNYEFRVKVAGVGDDLDSHRQRISRLMEVELDDRFVPAEEVGALFAGSDAIVLPYLDATQSGVGALAMASGRAIIATDVGAVGEVVRNNENGLIIPAGDPASLADAMARILTEKGLAARLGRNGAEMARNSLSWDRVAFMTEGAYSAARYYRSQFR